MNLSPITKPRRSSLETPMIRRVFEKRRLFYEEIGEKSEKALDTAFLEEPEKWPHWVTTLIALVLIILAMVQVERML